MRVLLLKASSRLSSTATIARKMSSRFRVYTRTGDAGTTSLFNGERRSKDEVYFAALGDVDELNAHIGLAREHCSLEEVGIEEQLVEIQSRLLDAGSAVATPQRSSSPEKIQRTSFPDHAAQLEAWIDAMDDTLPQLKNSSFSLLGGLLVHNYMLRGQFAAELSALLSPLPAKATSTQV